MQQSFSSKAACQLSYIQSIEKENKKNISQKRTRANQASASSHLYVCMHISIYVCMYVKGMRDNFNSVSKSNGRDYIATTAETKQ